MSSVPALPFSSRLLPSVGSHQVPAPETMPDAFCGGASDSAWWALLSLWEDALIGAVANTGPLPAAPCDADFEMPRHHYYHVWRRTVAGNTAASEAVATLLAQVATASDADDTLTPPLLLRSIRAALARDVVTGSAPFATVAQLLRACDEDSTVDGSTAFAEMLQQLAAAPFAPLTPFDSTARRMYWYTVMLLTQYRSSKRVAAKKWLAAARALSINAEADVERRAIAYAGIAASLTLCIPNPECSAVCLNPVFVALFWCSVISGAAAEQAQSSGIQGISVSDVIVPLVDLFTASVRVHLGGAPSERSRWRIAPSLASPDGGLLPDVYDSLIGYLFPNVWQQLGFEWPWSACVSDARSVRGNRDGQEALWADILLELNVRTFDGRLQRVLPPSLDDSTSAATVRSLPSIRERLSASPHSKRSALDTVCEQFQKRLAANSPEFVSSQTLSAIDALDFIVPMRAAAEGSSADAARMAYLQHRMVSFLYVWYRACSLIAVEEHAVWLFANYFAGPLASMRRDYDRTGSDATWSPFSNLLEWIETFLEESGESEAFDRGTRCASASLLVGLGAQPLVTFMISWYGRSVEEMAKGILPAEHGVSYHSSVCVTDIIAVVKALAVREWYGKELTWSGIGTRLRATCRAATSRLLKIQQAASESEARLARIEWSLWRNFLAELLPASSDADSDSESIMPLRWIPQTGCTQHTLCGSSSKKRSRCSE